MGVMDWLKKTYGSEQKEPPLPSPPEKRVGAAAEKEEQAAGAEYAIKRRHERFSVEGREMRAKAALADIIELCNISTAGCCIVTTKTLKPGDNVLLKLPRDMVSSPLKCTIIWERAEEDAVRGEAAPHLRKAGLRFSDLDTGTLVRIKDFMRLVGIPVEQKTEEGFRPGPLRFSIFTQEKAKLNYPVSFPVKKLSLGGMLAATETDLQEGGRYQMAVYLPDSERPVKFRGRVASKIAREGGFDIGVEFCDMTAADRERLAAFIKTLQPGR
jgi:hypothetical protein